MKTAYGGDKNDTKPNHTMFCLLHFYDFPEIHTSVVTEHVQLCYS